MNIQELNRSGQTLRVFLSTAAAAILITLLLWLASYLYLNSEARAWLDQITECRQRRKDTETIQYYEGINRPSRVRFTLSARLAMILWLMLNGNTIWMIKSGAWSAILLNHQEVGYISFRNADTGRREARECDTACHYVTAWSRRPKGETSKDRRRKAVKDPDVRFDFWPGAKWYRELQLALRLYIRSLLPSTERKPKRRDPKAESRE